MAHQPAQNRLLDRDAAVRGRLFVASGGHAFALDPESGAILWHNKLPKLGNGALCLATVRVAMNAGADPLPQYVTAAQQAAAAAGGTVVVTS